MVIFHSYVKLPEGIFDQSLNLYNIIKPLTIDRLNDHPSNRFNSSKIKLNLDGWFNSSKIHQIPLIPSFTSIAQDTNCRRIWTPSSQNPALEASSCRWHANLTCDRSVQNQRRLLGYRDHGQWDLIGWSPQWSIVETDPILRYEIPSGYLT